MIKVKHYLKIGVTISLVAHIGIFALGGYVMDSLTKTLDTATVEQTDDDITYIDSEAIENVSDKQETSIPENHEAEIIINDESIEDIPTSTEDVPPPAPEETEPPKADDNPPTEQPHKLRKLGDLNIVIRKFEPVPLKNVDITNIKDSRDLMNTISFKAKPIYDYNIIPPDEEVHIVICYRLNPDGTLSDQFEILRPTENTSIPGISPEELEDLKAAAIEAVQKSKIEPAKNEEARTTPQQIQFNFTREGPIDVIY